MAIINIDTEEIAKWSAVVTASFLGLKTIWSRIIKPMFISYQYVNEMLSKLDTITKELQHNGGTSLKDAIYRIESRQMRAEGRARALLNDSDAGIWESDSNGNCIDWNRTLQGFLGRSPEGMNWLASVVEEQREEVLQDWEEAVRTKREFYKDITYTTPAGNLTYCTVKAYPLLDQTRSTEGWYGIATKKESSYRRK